MEHKLIIDIQTGIFIGGMCRDAGDGHRHRHRHRLSVIDRATERAPTSVASGTVDDAIAAVDAA